MVAMTALRMALIEDEPVARRRLVRLLEDAGCVVVGAYEHGEAFFADQARIAPLDGLFLDIQLPGANGFEILAEIPDPPAIIFVTAFSDEAVRGFEVRAVDYLVKPVYADRLQETLVRVQDWKARRHLPGRPPHDTPKATQPTLVSRVMVKAGDGRLFLEMRRITHFEVEQEVVWCWSGGQRYRTHWTNAREVIEALHGVELIKIQRNLLLRPEAVLGYKPLMGGRIKVRLIDNLELEVSRSATPQLRDWLSNKL